MESLFINNIVNSILGTGLNEVLESQETLEPLRSFVSDAAYSSLIARARHYLQVKEGGTVQEFISDNLGWLVVNFAIPLYREKSKKSQPGEYNLGPGQVFVVFDTNRVGFVEYNNAYVEWTDGSREPFSSVSVLKRRGYKVAVEEV